MTRIRPIRNEEDHTRALLRLSEVFDAEPTTDAGDEAELLTILIGKYEGERFDISPPEPIEAICFRMDQLGITQEEMARRLDERSGRLSEILRGHRSLTLNFIRKCHLILGVPAEALLQPSAAIRAAEAKAQRGATMISPRHIMEILAENQGRPIWGGPGGEIRMWCDDHGIQYGDAQGWGIWQALQPLQRDGAILAFKGPRRRKLLVHTNDQDAIDYCERRGWGRWEE